MVPEPARRRMLRTLAAVGLFGLSVAFLINFFSVRFTFATGTLLLGLAALMPLRQEDEKWELLWDTAGWVVSLFIGLCCGLWLRDPTIEFIRSIPWIQEYQSQLLTTPDWVLGLFYLLLADFFCYWAHRFLHWEGLWDHHAWHHSPTYLNWLSGSRTTLVNYAVITTVPAILVSAVYHLPRAPEAALAIMGIQRFADLLHHTNLRIPGSRYWEYLVVTPRFHFVHHHRERRYNDTNFGFVFSFWDRLFGTYTDPESLETDFPLGLNYQISPWRLVLGLSPPVQDGDLETVAEGHGLDELGSGPGDVDDRQVSSVGHIEP